MRKEFNIFGLFTKKKLLILGFKSFCVYVHDIKIFIDS